MVWHFYGTNTAVSASATTSSYRHLLVVEVVVSSALIAGRPHAVV
jgi:hypothetical protein